MRFILILVFLSGCAYNVKKITPEFIDIDRMSCRVYKVTEDRPKIIFAFDKEVPIRECNGHMAFPEEQVLDMKNYYEEYVLKKKSSKTAKPNRSQNPIEYELHILNGIENP